VPTFAAPRGREENAGLQGPDDRGWLRTYPRSGRSRVGNLCFAISVRPPSFLHTGPRPQRISHSRRRDVIRTSGVTGLNHSMGGEQQRGSGGSEREGDQGHKRYQSGRQCARPGRRDVAGTLLPAIRTQTPVGAPRSCLMKDTPGPAGRPSACGHQSWTRRSRSCGLHLSRPTPAPR
jgi:hypothetical protein